MSLLTIAKRQLRKGAEDHNIVDVIRLADQLELDAIPVGSSAHEIVEKGKKELARETTRVRRAAFRLFIEHRNENANPSTRSAVFEEITATVREDVPSWEPLYLRSALNVVRQEFDLAMDVKPIKRIGGPLENLPPCSVCKVSRADSERLNFDTLEIAPVCFDCAADQIREL